MFQDKIGLRAGPFAIYDHLNSKNTYSGIDAGSSSNSQTDDLAAGLKLDLVFYPVERLGFAASLATLDYEWSRVDNANQVYQFSKGVNFNVISNGLSLSVFYVFGTK